ncbi:Wzz/FepE/Etk N-terminal domain-containing protein [Thiocapsa bogorovii]|uniref:Wzz/FepE/Etk N-terminal domain-containing protein n=1 Tax=Thiocapsa bogorovii TaxID=521689 RepID=UPI001E42229A|nr:Wzz/FepE/Etk N-terminal domain-containing protein [Thiocapsa bogorovii]UHD16251.1 Wzz/FepE/Etk N-terminal domain-containing protein [Thiocapsa bogorovii]
MDYEQEYAPNLADYLAILKRRKWQLVLPIVILLPLAVLVAITLPPVYRATATILIEQQEIPADLIRTTVTSFADQRIQVIRQRVMTTSNLSGIIERYNLYPSIREKQGLNAAVAEMREQVHLDMISADVVDPRSGRAQTATIAFTLAFEDPSPVLTQRVTNELVSLFMNENLRQREAAVEEATTFLREEATRLADQIAALEAALSEFKQQHSDNLPELLSINRELLARTEQQLRDNTLALRTLTEQKLYLETTLAQQDPQLMLGVAGAGWSADSPQARLQLLETQYLGLATRYSPEHPDRQRIERELAALRQEVGASAKADLSQRRVDLAGSLAAARGRYSSDHPDVQRLERELADVDKRIASPGTGAAQPSTQSAQNPAYVQLQSRLDALGIEMQGLEQTQTDLEERIEIYQQRLMESPNVEREYNNLTRGYENAVAKYREVKDKQLEAELAQALERERKAERFTLIEPPVVPDEPIKPNRPAIMMLGVVASIGAGVGHLALREILDKGIRSLRVIQSISGMPPLAVVPYIQTPADRRRRVRRTAILAGAAGLTLAVGLMTIHFFYRPLDLLWFTLLRRLEPLMPSASTLGSLISSNV